MIWLLLICFNVATAIAAGGATILFKGRVELRDSREASVRKKSDYSGVIVSLEPTDKYPGGARSSHHVQMLQKDKTFRPHILPVEVGTVVDFPNADPIFHNAFSSYNGQMFDIGLYPPGSSRSVRFSRPGIVRVFCNIHPSMSAVIVVLETPYFAITDKEGSFQISAPPGDYTLNVYHERATAQQLRLLSRPVHGGEGMAVLPAVVISESGYVPAPHKNKYNQDYGAPPDDRSTYPGVRK